MSEHRAHAADGCYLLQGMMPPSMPQPSVAVISSYSPSCFVMALASSAHSGLGLGAFGGFESQSAELFLRTNQKEKKKISLSNRPASSKEQSAVFIQPLLCCLHAAFCPLAFSALKTGASLLSDCLLLGQVPVAKRIGHRFGNHFTTSSDH